MVNSNIEHKHEWECSDVPGIFNCLSCDDIRLYNYIDKQYKIYPKERVK